MYYLIFSVIVCIFAVLTEFHLYMFSLCRSGFPIIRLQNYFANITSGLNRCYISVTTMFFLMVVFTDNQTVKSNSPSPSGEDRWGLIFNTY